MSDERRMICVVAVTIAAAFVLFSYGVQSCSVENRRMACVEKASQPERCYPERRSP